ncbi:MAG: hypothetical protein RJA70_2589 [Pseudomonadota bacterium]
MAAERRKAARREQAQALAATANVGAGETSPSGAVTEASPGRRDLGTAFARAMPYAAHPDRIWQALPTGYSATLDVKLSLVDGALKAPEDAVPSVSQPLARLALNTQRLLKGGQFALPSRRTADSPLSGEQQLRVRVRLSDVDAPESLELGFQAPTPTKPGHAYFVLESGRRFDATIELLP